MFASSRYSAPSSAAMPMMRSMWSMFRRWITTFITIGQPWSLMILATRFFSSKVLVCDRKSFISRVESWNDSWTWSRPGGLQRRGALGRQADAGGQQVGVVAQAPRLGDDRLEVVAHQRLAARQAELHGAQLAPFAQHAQPVVGAEFFFLPREVDRVVAEHAVQRAAVGQLGQQPQRRARAQGGSLSSVSRSHLLSPMPASAACQPSRRTPARPHSSPVVEKACSSSPTMPPTLRCPSQRFMISPALWLSLTMPSG